MSQGRLIRMLASVGALALLASAAALCYLTRPHYVWLTFGPQERLKLLVCDRGLWFAVQHSVEGKLRSPTERYRHLSDMDGTVLHDPDSQTTYRIFDLQYWQPHGEAPHLFASVDVAGPLAYQQYCDVSFAGTDEDSARVAKFHAPLAIGPATIDWKVPAKFSLERGNEGTTLRGVVGTMDEACGCWVVVSSHKGDEPRFPQDVRPEVEIAFPARSSEQAPIVERLILDQVCCGCAFYTRVHVPEEAGEGKARLTFSFPTWTGAQVTPSTIELPIEPAPAKVVQTGAAQSEQ